MRTKRNHWKPPVDPYDVDLPDTHLSVRTREALRMDGVGNIADLAALINERGWDDLLLIPNFGRKALNEVKDLFRE